MNSLTSSILRKLISKLIFRDHTYLLGMVFVRFSRKLRKKSYLSFEQNKQNEIIIENCLGGLRMQINPYNYMGGSIYWSGFHHIAEIVYLNRFLHTEMNFVDIGANQGEFSLFAASKIKDGQIYSFEPVKRQFNTLIKNKEINNITSIIPFNFGLSDTKGELPIYTSSNTNLHHGNHEGLSTLYPTEERNILEDTVQLEVFDTLFFENLKRLDFIKIDIEGAELFALQGMKKTISKFKPEILIEINDETFHSAGYSSKEMISFLAEFGYKPYKIFRGNLISIDNINTDWGNYIFKI